LCAKYGTNCISNDETIFGADDGTYVFNDETIFDTNDGAIFDTNANAKSRSHDDAYESSYRHARTSHGL
jgi:hypothetical protein